MYCNPKGNPSARACGSESVCLCVHLYLIKTSDFDKCVHSMCVSVCTCGIVCMCAFVPIGCVADDVWG